MMSSQPSDAGLLAESATTFREELGFVAGGPVVMSGHQAGLWHPGIVAKYAALGAAKSLGQSAWLVADLDDNDPTKMRVPTRSDDGVIRVEVIDLCESTQHQAGVPTGLQPSIDPTKAVPASLTEVAARLEAASRPQQSLAEQYHEVAADMLDAIGLSRAESTVFARALNATNLFAAVLDQMSCDPASCVESYNAAVASNAQAGVRMLRSGADGGGWELPIWRVAAGEPRRSVVLKSGERLDPVLHAPKGLLMTGMMRMAGCDLFIHGTGGGVYDTITERWLSDWLGAKLAPAVVVTATMYLDCGIVLTTDASAQAVIATAHRARHDPALLGDDERARAKRRLVDAIAALDRGSNERHRLFQQLHMLLDESRSGAGDRLAELDRQAVHAHAALASREAISDRTFSFVLHPLERLQAMDTQLRAMFT